MQGIMSLLALFLLFFSPKVLSVDYLSDQNSQLLNQFLLNPESIVSNTEKLLAIAQYISKTLDSNQTMEEVKNQIEPHRDNVSNSTRGPRLGSLTIKSHYFVNQKCFISNKSIITNGLIEGTAKVLRRAQAIQFFSKTLETNTLQAGTLYNPSSGIFIHGDVVLGKVQLKQGLRASSFIVNGVNQWNLWSHDDFDDLANQHNWNSNKTNRCSSMNGNYFLGGHCNLASDELQKTFINLPEHSKIRVQATFHMFDNWQGEFGYMKIGKQQVWKQTGLRTPLKTMNLCGNEDFDDPHMNLKIDEVVSHNTPNFTLIFGTSLNRNPCEASFAIDDVIVYIK